MQIEIKNETPVFSEMGSVKNCGWSRSPMFLLDKGMCKNRFQLNERDSYLIQNEDVTVYLSIGESGITGEVTAVIYDRNTGVIDHRTLKKYMSFGGLSMPASSKNGDVTFTDARVGMNFSNTAVNRYIRCEYVDFCRDKTLYINLSLLDSIEESFNVLMPINRFDKGFYLKRFQPAMKVKGVVRCGGAEYNMTYEDTSALLYWQRYVLKEKTYYHSLFCDVEIDGRQFAMCLSGGIGNSEFASGNCYFLDGEVHKFASVKAEGKEERPDKPWHFTAGHSAMDILFRPDIKSGRLMSVKCGAKTLVFGKLYGRINQMNSPAVTLDAVPAQLEYYIT
ncbi:MAG: DUF2804 family protein [Ruminococcus sp.]